jgi:hypothetical protein
MKSISLAVLTAVVLSLPAHAEDGLRRKNVVLKGVLVSAGGPGGKSSLSDELVGQLCEQGYSTIFYLYNKNFTNKGTHSCGDNNLEYLHTDFQGKGLAPIFRRVQQVADHGGGPVLVHCWNGRHAAGAVAAFALQQFCGWSGKQAERYWLDNAIDGEGYTDLRRAIRKFKPSGDFAFSSSQKASYCP